MGLDMNRNVESIAKSLAEIAKLKREEVAPGPVVVESFTGKRYGGASQYEWVESLLLCVSDHLTDGPRVMGQEVARTSYEWLTGLGVDVASAVALRGPRTFPERPDASTLLHHIAYVLDSTGTPERGAARSVPGGYFHGGFVVMLGCLLFAVAGLIVIMGAAAAVLVEGWK